jgi:hypothetical protein
MFKDKARFGILFRKLPAEVLPPIKHKDQAGVQNIMMPVK